jgi:hypothetical protein
MYKYRVTYRGNDIYYHVWDIAAISLPHAVIYAEMSMRVLQSSTIEILRISCIEEIEKIPANIPQGIINKSLPVTVIVPE